MQVLTKNQRLNLFDWFIIANGCPKTHVFNLTLTFDLESRRTLRHEEHNENRFVKQGIRMMLKLSRKLQAHVFGYIANETASISSKTEELVGAHLHILMAVRFEHIATIVTREDIRPLWKHSSAKQIVLQSWDGSEDLIRYNYGEMPDHFHNVTITTVFHPRWASCRNGSCLTCLLFPTPESILEK